MHDAMLLALECEPALKAKPALRSLQSARTTPLAALDVPAGHATATSLAVLLPPMPAVYDIIVVYEVSVSPASSSPGQNVAGTALHCLMSPRLVCAPGVMAQPGAMLVQF